jgi:hypothetical protein
MPRVNARIGNFFQYLKNLGAPTKAGKRLPTGTRISDLAGGLSARPEEMDGPVGNPAGRWEKRGGKGVGR